MTSTLGPSFQQIIPFPATESVALRQLRWMLAGTVVKSINLRRANVAADVVRFWAWGALMDFERPAATPHRNPTQTSPMPGFFSI